MSSSKPLLDALPSYFLCFYLHFGIVIDPTSIIRLVVYLHQLPKYQQPLDPKPPWTLQNEAFKADIAGFIIGLLVYGRMAMVSDPFWAIKGPPVEYNLVPCRPPPDPDPLYNPFKVPTSYLKQQTKTSLNALHRLHHLRSLESRHFRLLCRSE